MGVWQSRTAGRCHRTGTSINSTPPHPTAPQHCNSAKASATAASLIAADVAARATPKCHVGTHADALVTTALQPKPRRLLLTASSLALNDAHYRHCLLYTQYTGGSATAQPLQLTHPQRAKYTGAQVIAKKPDRLQSDPSTESLRRSRCALALVPLYSCRRRSRH